jgi:hypothetical protein
MEKTWKGTTAGVLEIAAGIFMLFAGIELSHIPIFLIMFISAGVISLLGGVCALTRHLRGLAVAGAIFSMFCTPIIGVPALWLILDAKKEFG